MIKRITSYALLLPMTMSSTFIGNVDNNKMNTKSVEIKEEISLPNGGRTFSDEAINKVEEYIARKEEEARLAEIARLEEEARIKAEQERIAAEQARLAEEQARLEALAPNFNPYNLREGSNLTKSKAQKLLEGSALQSAAGAYVYAEEVYGVNAIFLMALTSLESGHGRSEIAISRNNIGGVKSGSSYKYYSDWGECIMDIARFINELYLTEGAIYFNGYSIKDVNVKYCQDSSDWSGMITTIGYELLVKY